MKRPPLLSVAMAPHAHVGSTVAEIYGHQALALLPAAIGGVVLWGLAGLRVILLTVGCVLVFEWLGTRLMKREGSLLDGSALLQGLMLGLLLHAGTPWWLVVVAALVMVVLGRCFFGGLGGYALNPVFLTYAILLVSWPARVNAAAHLTNRVLSFPAVEPLIAWRTVGNGAVDSFPLGSLLLGQQIGGVGSSMVLLLVLGGLYLVLRGFIAWRVPLAFLAGMFLTALILNLSDPVNYAPPLFHLFSGVAMFTAFFVLSDFTTGPVNPWAQVVYGVGCGLLAVIIRTFGIFPDGTIFAVLLMNLAHPLIDKIHSPLIAVEVPTR